MFTISNDFIDFLGGRRSRLPSTPIDWSTILGELLGGSNL